MSLSFPKERIEKAARMYKSNRDASEALGILPGSFGRLCRKYNIITPSERVKGGVMKKDCKPPHPLLPTDIQHLVGLLEEQNVDMRERSADMASPNPFDARLKYNATIAKKLERMAVELERMG
jgi:hypothetical protein